MKDILIMLYFFEDYNTCLHLRVQGTLRVNKNCLVLGR